MVCIFYLVLTSVTILGFGRWGRLSSHIVLMWPTRLAYNNWILFYFTRCVVQKLGLWGGIFRAPSQYLGSIVFLLLSEVFRGRPKYQRIGGGSLRPLFGHSVLSVHLIITSYDLVLCFCTIYWYPILLIWHLPAMKNWEVILLLYDWLLPLRPSYLLLCRLIEINIEVT